MSQLPDSIFKRDVLFGAKKVTAAQLADFARNYEKAQLLSDAIDFYAQAQAKEDLLRLAQSLAQEGDTFHLLKVIRLLGSDTPSDAWLRTCADRARSLEKHRYALLAYERLEMESEAEAIRQLIQGDGDRLALAEQDTFIASHQDEIDDAET